nr:adenylate/guanylate cyclase domain-containing protein [Gammaproteobacteria bacterium]
MPTAAKALLFGAAVGILGIIASSWPLVLDVEAHLGLKLLFWLRGPRPAPPEVVIVTIGRESADHFRLRDEPALWPRALHARAVQQLSARGARVIALDIAFEKPQHPEQDRLLARALQEAENVVLFQFLRRDLEHVKGPGGQFGLEIQIEQQQPLLPEIARAAWGIAPFPLPKVPVRVDGCWFFKGSAGDIPTLPAVAFQAYALGFHAHLLRLMHAAGADPDTPPPQAIAELSASRDPADVARRLRHLLRTHPGFAQRLFERLEDRRHVATPAARRVLSSLLALYVGEDGHYLDFYGPAQSILTVPYHHLLDPTLSGKHGVAPMSFSGKVVFVGFAEQLQAEQRDGFYTVFSRPDGVDLSGVEIAATAFANILEGRRVQLVRGWTYVALIGGFGIVTGALLLALPPVFIPFAAAGIILGYVTSAHRAFLLDGTWLPLAVPFLLQLPLALLGALLWRHAHAQRQHQQAHVTFGHYVPQGMVGTLIRDRAALTNCRRFVYGACLATDAEQYSRLSETLSPDQLRRFLNRYYQELFDPVSRHGGFISDVVGDAMLAIWAGTLPEKKLRQGACRAALDILQEINRYRLQPGQAALPTRFGLHAGVMVLGNVGAGEHFEYRAVGDVVNTAHRLEQLNKVLGTRILASAEVVRGLDGVISRALGSFQLAGKRRTLLVYELLGLTNDIDLETERLYQQFTVAMEAFRAQRFAEAQKMLRQLLARHPHDGPSHFYMGLCQRLQHDPSQLGWDGIIKTREQNPRMKLGTQRAPRS